MALHQWARHRRVQEARRATYIAALAHATREYRRVFGKRRVKDLIRSSNRFFREERALLSDFDSAPVSDSAPDSVFVSDSVSDSED